MTHTNILNCSFQHAVMPRQVDLTVHVRWRR
ncbi:hypothetical protein HNQ51_000125 [Inhella inkyongensis]|uniref:Uncharacterized protein n=1 Tax=Inhella inkyongensis TaxID=392593 RepID=A0A840S009_9BURK|nr:hypothetical protein [Inhella inkyongensis]